MKLKAKFPFANFFSNIKIKKDFALRFLIGCISERRCVLHSMPMKFYTSEEVRM